MNLSQVIDFCPLMSGSTPPTSNMDNSLGKILCRLNKGNLLDMRIREDQFSDSNYFLIQSSYGA